MLILLFASCSSAPSSKSNQTESDHSENAVQKNSGTIDKDIINQIINHYQQLYKKDIMQIYEDSDSLIGVSFCVKPENKNDSDIPQRDIDASISKRKRDYISGDIDNDGSDEIICSVEADGGGTMYWHDIFVFSLVNKKYQILTVKESSKLCGCTESAYPPVFYPKKIIGGLIYGTSICWDKDDIHSSPSLKYNTSLKFEKGKLVFVKKKQVVIKNGASAFDNL